MPPKQPTILFFDLDGTLMTNPFWSVVFPTVSDSLAQQTGQTSEAMFRVIMAEHDRRLENPFTGKDRPRTMDWEDIFATVGETLHAKVEVSAEELVITHAAPPYTAFLDDAPQILRTLRDDGQRKLVTASMGLAKYQFPVMKALGLYECFDDYLMPDLTAFLKTDAEFYGDYLKQDALRIHVGDRYDHDCHFPKSLGGLSVIRLPLPELEPYSPFERPHYLKERRKKISGLVDGEIPVLPDAVVVHLSELPDVITAMEQPATL